ncbi:DUF5689 domain-containing protein [Sphingobacterium hungaricum]|uniref:DUF5689 domain-containing protein n=1 Tax=Sphingobacterium hungaricum TaxID=2082723 RepID=A0A928V0G7_9SPHI|nr:DUF5689 domain-containing protein [Sphingobacterium hungaricum]MBE8714212.1 hypothetical protein [Sphingobacterium hungaricum]
MAIKGSVISDKNAKNIDDKTLYVQQGDNLEGIRVVFKEKHAYSIDDAVEINIYNTTLSKANGELALTDVPNEQAKKIDLEKIAPQITSLAYLEANKDKLDGSLVTINAGMLISSTNNLNGDILLKDISGDIEVDIKTDASFAKVEAPKDFIDLTGILRVIDGKMSIAPRNLADFNALQFVTDDFTTWEFPNVHLSGLQSELFTSIANWYGDRRYGAIKQLADKNDANFTQANKLYPYIPTDSMYSSLGVNNNNKLSLKGVKVIKVTFAGSQAIGYTEFSEISRTDGLIRVNVLPFTTNVDEIKVGLALPISTEGEKDEWGLTTPFGQNKNYLIAASEAYKENGKFFTATFLIPTTLEDIRALGIESENASQWFENPIIEIINLSSRKTSGISTSRDDRHIPILIDKVEFGF